MMAKPYELSDEVWDVVSDLFIETHSRRRPRLHFRLNGQKWLCHTRLPPAVRVRSFHLPE